MVISASSDFPPALRLCLVAALAFAAGTIWSEPSSSQSRTHLCTASSPPPPFASSSTCYIPVVPPIPCRDDIVLAAVQGGFLDGKGSVGRSAEVGVFRGGFAAKNLPHLPLGHTYFMIDAWQWRGEEAGSNDKNFKTKEENDENFNAAMGATDLWASKRQMIREFSVPAAASFSNSSFDWVYIDALHTYEAVLADIHAWWPKVRPGGLFSGDDYGDVHDTELFPAHRSVSKFGPIAHDNNWGVIRAVQEFALEKGLEAHVTWANDCYPHPAWYIFKPCQDQGDQGGTS